VRGYALGCEMGDDTNVPMAQRFAAAFELSPVAMMISEAATGRVLDVNRAATHLTGYDVEAFRGRSTVELGIVAEADRRAIVERAHSGGPLQDLELTIRTRTGEARDVLFSSQVITLDGVPHLLSALHDVTARRRAEAALATSNARFRQLTDAIREVFWLVEVDPPRVLYLSPAYEAIWGRSCDSA